MRKKEYAQEKKKRESNIIPYAFGLVFVNPSCSSDIREELRHGGIW